MSQNQTHFGFFDNPPNMGSQKKTGHFADNFSEDFESINSHQNNQFNGFEQNHQGLEWRQPQQESRIPDFTKSLFGKVTFVVGRRQSGKTTLIKEIVQREVEILKNQSIINHFPKVVILTQDQNHQQAYSNCRSFQKKPFQSEQEGWEYVQFLNKPNDLIEMVRDQAIDNSLVIIEDDLILDDLFKSNFFNDVQKRNITLIMALTCLPKINSQVASEVDYLFLCKNLPYCELQRIGNAFLSIKLPSFIRIYTEIVVNNDSIAVVDISPENLRPQNKSNLKHQNMMKLLYKYPLVLKPVITECRDISLGISEVEASNFDTDSISNITIASDNISNNVSNKEKDQPVTSSGQLLEKTIIQTIDDVVFNLDLLKTQLGKYFQEKFQKEKDQ